MNLAQRRAQIAVASTLGVLLLLALLGGQYVWQKHVWATEKLAEIEPRYARLLGLRDSGGSLEQSLKEARAAVARLGYPAERDAAQVGNDLQQLVRKALQSAGLTLASSQVLAPRSEAGFDRISVSLQAEGALSGVQVALAALQAETPSIAVENLILQSTGRSAEDGSPVVSCRLTVSVLRLQA
jgi:general secretion pathway protein M